MVRQLSSTCALLLMVAACTPPGRGTMNHPESRDGLLEEAKGDLKPVHMREQVDDKNADISPDSAVEGIEVSIFKMRRKFPRFLHHPTHKWIAAVQSNKDYPRMNIGKGMNYIFALPDSESLPRWVIVPSKPGMRPRRLIVKPKALTTRGAATPPKVVRREVELDATLSAYVIGVCIECATGHCNSTSASATAYK